MAADDWSTWVHARLGEIRDTGQWRTTRTFDARGPAGEMGGRSVVSFASNDYLGLSGHPDVVAAAHGALDRWGAGATASRLIVGTRPCHEELEAELASWKEMPRAVLFPTGYAANLGVMSTLAGPDVSVFSDALNHASIIDGCRLARASTHVYQHGDVEHLGALLAAAPQRRLVVSDAVFSMDGDVAPVGELVQACERHGAALVLDEAHAVLGPPVDLPDGLVVARVGTLSKALGSLGGFVAASDALADLLVNRARPYIFTTGLSPADAAAALAALRIVRSAAGDELVARLRAAVSAIRPGHASPIVPVLLGDEARAVAASAALLDHGVLVPAIRPPTVPTGTSRLRIALSAAHTDDMLHLLRRSLSAVGL